MATVNESRSPSQPEIKPCDCFDLICGTSTGGLLALMLGRLEFTVDQAIEMYIDMAQTIFHKEKSWLPWRKKRFAAEARYDHGPLEQKLKEAISKSPLGVDGNASLVDNDRRCKSFVVTTCLKKHSAKPVLLRSYDSDFNVPELNKLDIKVWEAGRATSAAPTYFLPYEMADGVEYTDGGTIANNPTELGYHEAGRLWPGRKIRLILSIGTGRDKDLTLANAADACIPYLLRRALRVFAPDRLYELQIATYAAMAMTNADRPHERVQDNIKTYQYMHDTVAHARPETDPPIYFRLNVDHGDAAVPLDACGEMGMLRTLARDYMEGATPRAERSEIAAVLLEKEDGHDGRLVVPPRVCAVADRVREKSPRRGLLRLGAPSRRSRCRGLAAWRRRQLQGPHGAAPGCRGRVHCHGHDAHEAKGE